MIVAGIGLRKNATVASLRSALALACADGADTIATPADKSDHPAMVALSQELGLPVRRVSTMIWLPNQLKRNPNA